MLVDGRNLLNRAAFGFPARITSRSGRDITVVLGFFALVRAHRPHVARARQPVVVFDGEHSAVQRRSLCPYSKPPASGDEEVFADLPRVHDGLRLLVVPCIQTDQPVLLPLAAEVIGQLRQFERWRRGSSRSLVWSIRKGGRRAA